MDRHIYLSILDEKGNQIETTDITDKVHSETLKHRYGNGTTIKCGIYNKSTGKQENGLITIVE